MNDDEMYESVIKEIQERRLDQPTWAKALIDSEGDEAVIVARYIRLRIAQLKAIRRSTRIALWNPAAAAQWSVAFTPLFGAYIHMRNWQAMGEYKEALQSRKWILGSLVLQALILVLATFLPFPENIYFVGFGFAGALLMLLAWYSKAAKKQAQYVSDHFGHAYKRNSWTEVVFIAFAVWLSFFFLLTAIVVTKFKDGRVLVHAPMVNESQFPTNAPNLIPVTTVETIKPVGEVAGQTK